MLIVSEEQWPRALLRAQLVEEGWDAVGARSMAEALREPVAEPGRGPVRCLVVDASALGPAGETGSERVEELRTRHGDPPVILLASATIRPPAGRWTETVRRPTRVKTVVEAVERAVGGRPTPT